MITAQSPATAAARPQSGAFQPSFSAALGSDSPGADGLTDSSMRPSDGIAGRSATTWKVVYAIVERGPRKHWLRIGMAFVNRDGSLNVRLDAVPLSGQLHIRDNPPRDDREPRESLSEPVPSLSFERSPAPIRARSRPSAIPTGNA